MLFFQGEIKWHGLHQQQLIYVLGSRSRFTLQIVNCRLQIANKKGPRGPFLTLYYRSRFSFSFKIKSETVNSSIPEKIMSLLAYMSSYSLFVQQLK